MPLKINWNTVDFNFSDLHVPRGFLNAHIVYNKIDRHL